MIFSTDELNNILSALTEYREKHESFTHRSDLPVYIRNVFAKNILQIDTLITKISGYLKEEKNV